MRDFFAMMISANLIVAFDCIMANRAFCAALSTLGWTVSVICWLACYLHDKREDA